MLILLSSRTVDVDALLCPSFRQGARIFETMNPISKSLSSQPLASSSRKRITQLYQEQPSSSSASSYSSSQEYGKQITNRLQNLTRREATLLLVGGTAYAKLASDVLRKIQRGEAYPPEHENRASDTFEVALVTSFLSLLEQEREKQQEQGRKKDEEEEQGGELVGGGYEVKSPYATIGPRPLRVLEVGVGSCRTFMRGAYDSAIEKMVRITRGDEIVGSSSSTTRPTLINGIDFFGVDIDIPKDQRVVNDAREYLNSRGNNIVDEKGGSSYSFPISLNVQQTDITKGLPFPDGYFDAVTSSLVLCSVEDQALALNEIKRVLSPNGGTYGYIEHVAVNLENEDEKDLKFLDWQQQAFDPLQQVLAHNCHLHRNTDSFIQEIFMTPPPLDSGRDIKTRMIQNERFLVKDMWPVSCQSRGVIQFVE